MNKKEIKKYLKYLKFKKFYSVKFKKCEICNSKKTKLIQKKISWGNNKFGVLPIHCCLNCGFIFQNPRFSKQFYKEYYKKEYLDITKKTLIPSKKYLNDQKFRGNKLFNFLKPYIPKKGTMLDVGSSVGLMLLPFIKNSWTCYGNDPSKSFVEYGRNKLGLPIDCLQSEDMKLKKNSLDLIIIMGSLEHVYDVNVVLKKCSNAIKKGGILVLEARGDPLGNSKDFFNISHHRYFFGNTMELIMIKYGWSPFLTTKYPITGPTRENTIFCLGKYVGKKVSTNFNNLINKGKRETYLDIIYKLKYHNYLADKKRN